MLYLCTIHQGKSLGGFLKYAPKYHQNLRIKIKLPETTSGNIYPHAAAVMGRNVRCRDVFPCPPLHTKNFFRPRVIHMHEITMDRPCKPPTFWFDFTVLPGKTGPVEAMERVWIHFWGGNSRDTRQGGGKPRGACGTPGQMCRRQAKSDYS